jgi:hypothetical protein
MAVARTSGVAGLGTLMQQDISAGCGLNARGKKARSEETNDTFYCTVDGWHRLFEFGVNWRRGWKIEEGMGDRPYDEWDDIKVFGTVRDHKTYRRGSRRKFQKVEVRLYPTRLPRDQWCDDPDAVGGVYAEKGILHAGVYLAADAFYSLVPCFSANHYREVVLQVRDLRYTRGRLYRIEFHPEVTLPEDM